MRIISSISLNSLMHARLYISKSLFKHDYSNYQLLKASIPKKMQIEIFSVKNCVRYVLQLKNCFFLPRCKKKGKNSTRAGHDEPYVAGCSCLIYTKHKCVKKKLI